MYDEEKGVWVDKELYQEEFDKQQVNYESND